MSYGFKYKLVFTLCLTKNGHNKSLLSYKRRAIQVRLYFIISLWVIRIPDIRSHGLCSHAIFDRAGRSCTYQMTTQTFMHISNYHPGRSFPYTLLPWIFVHTTIWFSKVTGNLFIYSLHAYPLLRIALSF